MDDFDISYSLLPPHLQLNLWVLGLDADYSKVNIAYQSNSFVTALSYNYSNSLQASLAIQRFTATAGIDPANANINLGLVYQGYNFRAAGSVQPQQDSLSVKLTYGADPFPFPEEIKNTFNKGGAALGNTLSSLDDGLLKKPFEWYGLHGDEIGTISDAVSMGQEIYDKERERFGAGLRLNYTEERGLVIYGGVNFTF